ncbi:MAG: metallophosphoesterase [Planctomycetaceae bacterium]|jgi:predicted phosphodiesterase|nr:metallophosphoesterase [Planctomycetaceae bacterium]
MSTDRRQFIASLAVTGIAVNAAVPFVAGQVAESSAAANDLVDSPPVLQLPREDGITVVWAVSQPATGYVEYGDSADKLDRRADGELLGLNPYNERFLRIDINDLKPNTRYYYRTVTSSIDFETAYKIHRGEPVRGVVYSFLTPSSQKPEASFVSINDTHQNLIALQRITKRLSEIAADYTVWNGDLVNDPHSADQIVQYIMRPADTAFAAERPLLHVCGNHDLRGKWARNLVTALPAWQHSDPRDRVNGRNFAFRNGPLALIGLDTGEDKPDAQPVWAGLCHCESYRVQQRDWLTRVLERPEIKSAPHIAAFCHIPLFDSNPNANGGDVMEKWAAFQRQSGKLWGPLLNEYNVKLLVCGHTHRFRFDPATEDRKWNQLVGGGPQEKDPITIIHGKANADKLEVSIENVTNGEILGKWSFDSRKV